MAAAAALRIPHSEFLSWDESDQDLYLAHRRLTEGEDDERCPVCGLPKKVCQDPKGQRAWDVNLSRCYVTRARLHTMRGRENDPDAGALVTSVKLRPERVKT